MTLQVLFNGSDVTTYVTSYEREHSICSGIGTCSIILSKEFVTLYSPEPYDIIVVNEDGIKKGTYYVSSTSISHTSGTITIDSQDETKKLSDYFVSVNYLIDYESYSRFWIEKFLTEAGTSYVIDTDEYSSPISNNTYLGMASAYDLLVPLVQQNGWHFYADANNIIHIGKLDIDLETHDLSLPDESSILSIKTTQNDNILRNRVVVYGATNTADYTWVYAEAKTYTQYNYSQHDLRTAVLSNGSIDSTVSAQTLANRILKETKNISYTKDIELAGFYTVKIGETAYVNTRLYSGWGLVTNISVRDSTSGWITTVTLDQRCPRLYSYFGYGSNKYVYIGTNGSGVWRKLLGQDGWHNYSTGITDLNITDLAINRSVFSCVTSGGSLMYRKSIDASWRKYHPTNLVATMSGLSSNITNPIVPSGTTVEGVMLSGLAYNESDVVCMGCDINKVTANIYGVYTLSGMSQASGIFLPTGNNDYNVTIPINGEIPTDDWVPYSGMYWHSWLSSFTGYGYGETSEIIVNGSNNVFAYDVACNDTDVYIACLVNQRAIIEGSLIFPLVDEVNTIEYAVKETRIVPVPRTLEYTRGVTTESLGNFDLAINVYNDSYTFNPSIIEHTYNFTIDNLGGAPYDNSGTYHSDGANIGSIIAYDNTGRLLIRIRLTPSISWSTGGDTYVLFPEVFLTVLDNAIESYMYGKILLWKYTGGGIDHTVEYDYTNPNRETIMEYNTGPYLIGNSINTGKIIVPQNDNTLSIYENLVDCSVTSVRSLTLYLPGSNDPFTFGYLRLLHEIDPIDGSCYAFVSSSTHTPGLAYPYSYELIAFNLNTGIIARIYSYGMDKLNELIRIIANYSYDLHLYKNNIYSDLSSVPTNAYYNKMLELGCQGLINGVAKKIDDTNYTLLCETPQITHLELSQQTPLLAFGGNSVSNYGFLTILPLDDTTDLPIASGTGGEFTMIPYSNDFRIPLSYGDAEVISSGYVRDARAFYYNDNLFIGFTRDILSSGVMLSGVLTSGLSSVYLLNMASGVINTYALTLNYDNLSIPSSGIPTYFETSNLDDIPYLFIGISGAPGDFYERSGSNYNATISGYIEYVKDIPLSSITCIRLDDLL